MEQILPHLFRIPSRLGGPQHPVNSYLWKRDDGVVLIDPAADLTRAVVQGERVGEILITHVQEENVGGCVHFPEARIHVPAGDEYLCHGREAYERLIMKWQPPWDWEERGNYQGHLAGARNERPPSSPLALAEPLTPGKTVFGCQILATPGHGKHAITILVEIDGKRVAFCGDLIHGNGSLWNWFDSEWDYGLEGGPRALAQSAARLGEARPTLLCPTHGPAIDEPRPALDRLTEKLRKVLNSVPGPLDASVEIVNTDPEPATGFRQILPVLHQYAANAGNCAALLSETGNALWVDDGLCSWKPLPERSAHHREIVSRFKKAHGIRRIEMVIPTHYHGDHIENIPELVGMEGSRVVCLDTVAEVIECPGRFNLTCPLPWYGTAYDTISIDQRVSSRTKLRWHEYELEIFHLGGQTYYHAGIAVVVDGHRVLFVGDSLGNTSVLCEPVLCYNDCEPTQRGWLYAFERMIERQPDLLICGHVMAVRNPMPLLLGKREAWLRRREQYGALNPRRSQGEFFDPFLT